MKHPFGPIDYASHTVPDRYRCTTCGAHGCKLWREYQTCADYTELVCCDCAGKSQGEDVSQINAEGRIPFELGKDTRGNPVFQWCDQIGWRVPAVPTAEGDTFWGYTSVPEAGVRWWRSMPTRSEIS